MTDRAQQGSSDLPCVWQALQKRVEAGDEGPGELGWGPGVALCLLEPPHGVRWQQRVTPATSDEKPTAMSI